MTSNATWDAWWADLYKGVSEPKGYPGEYLSYELAGQFLSGDGLVEEWGCATTFGKQFFDSPYRGVDGAPSEFVDVVADLSDYRSDVPKAVIRFVLEHNWNWRTILTNFLDSFTDRAVVILFIPPGLHDINRSFEHRVSEPPSPPGLQLDEASLLSLLSRPQMKVVRQDLEDSNVPPFGHETIFYLKKGPDEISLFALPPKCHVKDCSEIAYETIHLDYELSDHRFQYAFTACRKCQDDMLDGLNKLIPPFRLVP